MLGHVPDQSEVLRGRGDACYTVAFRKNRVYLWTKIEPDGSISLTGPFRELLDIVFIQLLKHCYVVVGPEQPRFGKVLANGTTTGVFGSLQRKEFDMFAGVVTVDAVSARVVDFTAPLSFLSATIFWHKPELKPDISGFLKPFDALVWILLAVSVMLLAGVIFLFPTYSSNMRRGVWHRKRNNGSLSLHDRAMEVTDHSVKIWTFQSTLLKTVAILLGQSISVHTNFDRLLVFLWMFVSLTVASVYRSNLKAMLILPTLQRPFDTLEDFVHPRNNKFPLYIVETSELYALLQRPHQDVNLIRLRKKLLPVNISFARAGLFNTEHPGIYEMELMKFFLSDIFSKTGKCPYYLTKPFLTGRSLAMGFSKGSSLLPYFNKVIVQFIEAGVWDKMLWTHMGNSTKCRNSKNQNDYSSRSLVIEDLVGIFCLYGSGILLSTAVFACEVIYTKYWVNRSVPSDRSVVMP